jgi:2-phospho-L-lactate guanylyltransferase
LHVLVPVKASGLAKSRLSAVLDAPSRVQFVGWMLERVLRAAAGASMRSLSVVGGDAQSASIARRYGAGLIADMGGGLNAALSRAMAEVRRQGLPACMLLAADLPWLTPEDVIALVGASQGGRMAVIAPAQDGAGTNALIAPEGCAFEPAFGPASRARHHRVLARTCVPVTEVCRSGLAFDVDLPDHLARLMAAMAVGELEQLRRRIGRSIEAPPHRSRS